MLIYKLKFQRPLWDSNPIPLRYATKQAVSLSTVHSQVSSGIIMYNYILAYYSSDQSSKLSIPVVVQFATIVDVVSHNYNNAK